MLLLKVKDQLCETKQWKTSRWKNIHRDYTVEDVKKLVVQ